MVFQTHALTGLSDWLRGQQRQPDRLPAPSSKHQFENLPEELTIMNEIVKLRAFQNQKFQTKFS